jgi:predicted nucleic acid-binding protein
LDTNVLISALIAGGLSYDLFRLVLAEHELLKGRLTSLKCAESCAAAFEALAPRSALRNSSCANIPLCQAS